MKDLRDDLKKITTGTTKLPTVAPEAFAALSKSHDIVIYVLVVLVATGFFAIGTIWSEYQAMKQATYLELYETVQEQNRILTNFFEDYENEIKFSSSTKESK